MSSSVRPGTGLPSGGQSGPRTAGVIQPSRMPRSITLSFFGRLGGLISAMGRPRSVMTTVSPAAAARTYSLSLFLSVLRPTVRMPATWLPEATLSIEDGAAKISIREEGDAHYGDPRRGEHRSRTRERRAAPPARRARCRTGRSARPADRDRRGVAGRQLLAR